MHNAAMHRRQLFKTSHPNLLTGTAIATIPPPTAR